MRAERMRFAGNASTPVTTRVHVDAAAPKGTLTPTVGSGMRRR